MNKMVILTYFTPLFFVDGETQHHRLTDAMAYFWCKDIEAFSTIDEKGSRNIIREMCLTYKILTRNTIKAVTDKEYQNYWKSIEEGFSKSSIFLFNYWYMNRYITNQVF